MSVRKAGFVLLSSVLASCSATIIQQTACEDDFACANTFGGGTTCGDDGFCQTGSDEFVDGVSASAVRTVGIADTLAALSDLGEGMRDGVQAAFNGHNLANPNSRQFLHEVLNDGYDPEVSVAELESVTTPMGESGRYAFGIVGSMGSPTSNAMLPTINERQVPFFGTYSGANHLRKNPPDRMVWNTRASYALEGETITNYLLNRTQNPIHRRNIMAYSQSPLTIPTNGLADISDEAIDNETNQVLDPYGNSGYVGIVAALVGAGLDEGDIPLASYRATNTESDIAQDYFWRWVSGLVPGKGPLIQQDASGGDEIRVGVAMVPVASAATGFIEGLIDGLDQLSAGEKPTAMGADDWEVVPAERRELLANMKLVITSISPVGDQLANNLRTANAEAYCQGRAGATPIIVSQVVPDPFGGSRGALEFRADLEEFDSEIPPGFVNFEGWIAGKTWIAAVEETGANLTVDSLIDVLSTGDFSVDLGTGPPIAFSSNNHDGSTAVYGSILDVGCEYGDFEF